MKVIIDCDCGNDDSWAIFSLLRAEEKFNFKVLAISCVDGNTTVDNAARNTLMTLKTCNRMDVPVYKGATSSLIMKTEREEGFHGVDGLSGIYKEEQKPSLDLLQKKHAVEAIKGYIDEFPNEIAILTLAPLTNIALLYKLYPEISRKIKSLHIMGGNYLGVGNTTKHAEYNFYYDPEAAHIVFAETICPIFIFPWEPCLFAGDKIPFDEWRLKVLSSNDNPYSKFLDRVEERAYSKFTTWMPCDCFLAASFIIPQMITKIEEHHVTVELGGFHCRAMMVIDHLKSNKPNANVIKEIDVEMFKQFMLWVCGHEIPELDLTF